MGNSKSGKCPWTTVYNVHGICPLFHEEMLEKFHGQCPQYPGHCPWIPWTLSTHSMGSMDIVHTFHRFHGQCPLIPWKMSRMSMESMDFLQTGHLDDLVQSQGLRRNFVLKFLLKLCFLSLYLLNMSMDQNEFLHVGRYWSEVLCCTFMAHLSDLESKALDFEILC